MPSAISEEDAYLLDLNGFLVIRGALSPGEVSRLNSAIDLHSHLIEQSPSLADGPDSAALRGPKNVVGRIGTLVGRRLPS
eukprot:COSAG05_NODE_6732_length_912_cov_0.942189_1_plen_79_part_10